MKEGSGKDKGRSADLMIFDPEHLPFQTEHLCAYLRELGEGENKSEEERKLGEKVEEKGRTMRERRGETMFFELREYRIKGGKRARWVKLMEEKIIPFQMSKGMVAVGSFVATEEPDLYVWIRRFESEEECERLYEEVYESDYWKNVIKPEADEMLDVEKIRNIRLEATPKSVIR